MKTLTLTLTQTDRLQEGRCPDPNAKIQKN